MVSHKNLLKVLETSKKFYEEKGFFPTVLIEGRSGIGKSSIVKQFAEKNNFEVIDIRMINYTVGDLVLKVPEEDKLKNLYNEWLIKLSKTEKPVILLLDEIDKAEPGIQRLAYQIILDREVEGLKISNNVFIIAIQNTEEDGAFFDIRREKPLWDRFWIRVKLELNGKEWLNWASKNLNPYIYAFLEKNREREEKLLCYFSYTKNSICCISICFKVFVRIT